MTQRFICALALWFCTLSMFAQRQQPFEGIITYLVNTELKQDSSTVNKYYTQKYGDTLRIYYAKNGSEKREYNHTGSYGLAYEIYNKINNEQYTKWNGLDYVVYSTSADTIVRIDSISVGDTLTILGKTCQSLTSMSTDLKSGDQTQQTHYYSGEELILPHMYAKRKKDHLDKLYGQSESLFLGIKYDTKYATTTFTAIHIDRTKVDPNLFIIPNGILKFKKEF